MPPQLNRSPALVKCIEPSPRRCLAKIMKARQISAERQHPLVLDEVRVLRGERRERHSRARRHREKDPQDKVGFALVRFCADALWGAKLMFAASFSN